MNETAFRYEVAAVSTFRDREVCEKVRAIKREDLCRHPNPAFKMRIIDDGREFYSSFANDMVDRILQGRERGDHLVLILPVGPVPQFKLAAERINKERISLQHVETFNMDEYADENGNTAPVSWEGSFQRSMWESFFGRIDRELRPPERQIHFPVAEVIESYSARIADLGGADVCYGGVGWAGHIAFWEPHLAYEFAGDRAAFRAAGARLVELHPITVLQNALHSFGGDWSWVPPKANTIGPAIFWGPSIVVFGSTGISAAGTPGSGLLRGWLRMDQLRSSSRRVSSRKAARTIRCWGASPTTFRSQWHSGVEA